MATNITVPVVNQKQKYELLKILEWKFKEGDEVKQGDVLLIAESEKATHEIEAEATGLLHIGTPEGGKVMVGTAAGAVAENKEELEALQKG
jgi:pyruvate/2-oxoglutarate dehydrogenase complex dihydrolipoamide acyltransferase (E2) component